MSEQAPSLDKLLSDIRRCQICESPGLANGLARAAVALPFGARPIVQAHQHAELLIIGQAPGSKVHASGVPWDDASGDRLRQWLAMDKSIFYGKSVAIMPMGFCYPGRGKSGDLPPRKECARTWHQALLDRLPKIKLTVLIGSYAQAHYLPSSEASLTATVKNYRRYLPSYLPLPHPSPRNNIWLKKNPWFETEVLPNMQAILAS